MFIFYEFKLISFDIIPCSINVKVNQWKHLPDIPHLPLPLTQSFR
jgi:hypothetical protein